MNLSFKKILRLAVPILAILCALVSLYPTLIWSVGTLEFFIESEFSYPLPDFLQEQFDRFLYQNVGTSALSIAASAVWILLAVWEIKKICKPQENASKFDIYRIMLLILFCACFVTGLFHAYLYNTNDYVYIPEFVQRIMASNRYYGYETATMIAQVFPVFCLLLSWCGIVVQIVSFFLNKKKAVAPQAATKTEESKEE